MERTFTKASTGLYAPRRGLFHEAEVTRPITSSVPTHDRAVRKSRRKTTFFKLSAYTETGTEPCESGDFQDRACHQAQRDRQSDQRRLDDISISRPADKIGWASRCRAMTPVMYVCFEALLNYTRSRYPEHEDSNSFWPSQVRSSARYPAFPRRRLAGHADGRAWRCPRS